MEAAASIIAVIQLTSAVLNLTVRYYFHVKDARKDIKRLEDEVNDIQAILRKTVDIIDDSPDPAVATNKLPALSLLLQDGGPLQRCQAELSALAARLEKAAGGGGKDDSDPKKPMRQFGIRAMKWPFSSSEIQSMVDVFERCKASFNLALNTDQTKLALDTNCMLVELEKSFAASRFDAENYQKGEYKPKIIQWLSTVEIGVNWSNHEYARKRHQPGTGEWLIDHPAFEQWKVTPASVLWLYGKPGCGKTVLSSSIIEHLEHEYDAQAEVVLSYFYFDFGTPAKQSVTSCLRYVLSRLTSRIPKIPDLLKDLYVKKCNYGNESPGLSDLIAVFKLFAEYDGFQDVFVAIDALDECPTSNRSELLDFMETISSWTDSKLHIFLTSRPEPDIEKSLATLPAIHCIPIEGLAVARDIAHHVRTQLSGDPRLRKLPGKLKAAIEEKLITDADGMFRWVDCQLESLSRCKTKALLLETLRTLPKTLYATYERILQNIPSEDQAHARRALWWLVEACRPPTVEEVAEAAVLDPTSSPPFDPENRFFDPQSDILEILGSLVSVVRRGNVDEAADLSMRSPAITVSLSTSSEELRLSHFSVKEYLFSVHMAENMDQSVRMFHAEPHLTSSFVLESCLQYIFHYAQSEDRESNEDDLEQFPLLGYACAFWHVYASPAICGDKAIADSLNRLFSSEEVLNVWLLVYAPDQPKKRVFEEPDEPGQPLHYASSLGLTSVCRYLLGQEADVNGRTESGITPLHRAAEMGHVETAKLLLEHGADVSAATRGGRTPLHQAARSGHVSVIEALLEAGADIEAKDADNWTPCYWAAESRHEDITRLLLARGADPNSKTMSGGTALHQVCGRGYLELAQCLLAADAEVNVATTWGRTPLHQAAAAGSIEVVCLLLEHGADSASRDKSYMTPRDLAEENQHYAVAELLPHLQDEEASWDSGGED